MLASERESRQRKILDSIFKVPTLASIKFSDIEKLLVSPGVEVIEGGGSRVAFQYADLKFFVHRPHPGKEARKYQVELSGSSLKRQA